MSSGRRRSRGDFLQALEALATLQHKGEELKAVAMTRETTSAVVREWASLVGLDLDQLGKDLAVIHVAGTKGKGSVCAFTESILRSHGVKTGMFSSPHLVDVRERFRIDGRPISEERFAQCFWECYETFKKQDKPLPGFFRFLTLMGFKLFQEERVEALVLEVGIGGRLDATNAIGNPTVIFQCLDVLLMVSI
jgi:folylpolyglutamate synthase